MEHRFPLVPGMDASGTVEALGEGPLRPQLFPHVAPSVAVGGVAKATGPAR